MNLQDNPTDFDRLLSIIKQLTKDELLVTSLLFGLNRYGLHMTMAEISRATGKPTKTIIDSRNDAFRKIGSAVSRQELQEITCRALTPHSLAKVAQQEHKTSLRELKVT